MRKPPQPIRREKPSDATKPRAKPASQSRGQSDARPRARKTSKQGKPSTQSVLPAGGKEKETLKGGPSKKVLRYEERFAEKARMERRLVLRKALFIALAVTALAGVGWLVLFSPVFDLRDSQIAIVGAEHPVDSEEVQKVVAADVGEPLARLDLDEIGERVSGVRGVSNAIVRREWPHGLRVSVVPRVPVAAVESDEKFVLLDAEGEEVGEASEAPEGVAVASVPLDEDRERVLQAVLRVLDDVPDELREEISDIGAKSPDTVQFTLDDESVVEWGSADDSKLKASVLMVLREQGAAIYDVSAPTLPVTREK